MKQFFVITHFPFFNALKPGVRSDAFASRVNLKAIGKLPKAEATMFAPLFYEVASTN